MSADADVRRSVDVDETVEQLAQRVEAARERLATRQHKHVNSSHVSNKSTQDVSRKSTVQHDSSKSTSHVVYLKIEIE